MSIISRLGLWPRDHELSIAMTDAYHDIYRGEIFQKSQCIQNENIMLDYLRSQLRALGYHSAAQPNKVWSRDQQTVVVCLVDDFTTCASAHDPYVPKLFEPGTRVITDNVVTCPSVYTIHRLPASWFGIYWYDPAVIAWQPDRRFNLSVNRLDSKRMLLFLEYRKRLPWQTDRECMDYVNFNCWAWDGDNSSPRGFAQNWKDQWARMDQVQQSAYDEVFDQLTPEMPWRNHDLQPEIAMHRSWINLIIETYSGDSVIAVSEKIFRALLTPAPWMLYSGRYSVVYLESLGFDCISDIMDHGYDPRIETKTVDYGDKCVDWFWMAQENYARLQDLEFAWLQQRCREAADHNRDLLMTMRQQWPTQQAHWWSQLVTLL